MMKQNKFRTLAGAALAVTLVMTGLTATTYAASERTMMISATSAASIAHADCTMTGGYSTNGDTALGDLVTDGMRKAMKSDIAFLNGDGYTGEISGGTITRDELDAILPGANGLVKVTVRGADLAPILNSQLSAAKGADWSVSGLAYTWDPATLKVVSITTPDGERINPRETYSLTVTTAMLNSADAAFAPLRAAAKKPVSGANERDALADFVAHYGQLIAYEPEGRIHSVVDSKIPSVSIGDARALGTDHIVTVEGVITSRPGDWGGERFYIQDSTGGTFVYDMTDDDFHVGDKVRITGTTATSNGEFRIRSLISAQKVGHAKQPAPLVVTPNNVNLSNEGEVVQLQGVTISGLNQVDEFGTFEFMVNDANGESTLIRVDARTGLSFDQFKFHDGDAVTVTGISSEWNGWFQVMARGAEDIVKAGK